MGTLKQSALVLATALITSIAVAPGAQAAPQDGPAAIAPAAAKRAVPQGVSYWRVGSRLYTLERDGELYWYVSGGKNYYCEAGSIAGFKTVFGWAERVLGRAESGNSTGRMWLAGGRLQYRNAAMNNYSAKPAAASKANRKKGTKAMDDCGEKFG